MKINGDPDGIEELKKIGHEKKEYLKYVIKEAQTNTDLSTTFKSLDGQQKFKMTCDRMTGDLTVTKIG